jgi:conjugative transfer region lipoprotein (TIGR03751 family)
MEETMKIFTVLWISALSVVVVGCASSKEKVFRSGMPTMKTIYQEKFGHQPLQSNAAVKKRPICDHDLAGRAKQQYQALNKQFPFLHNPVLVTYVYPHLTQAGTPIPGYVTYFKLYQSHPIALPGEVSEKVISEVKP